MRELLLVINKKFDAVETSMNFHSGMVDDMHKTLQDMRNENTKLKKENENIKKIVKELQNILDLQLKNRSNEETSQRNKNLVFFGANGEEDVEKILENLNVLSQPGDYTVKIIPTKSINKPVIVTFKQVELRNKVIERRKAKKVLDTTEFKIGGPMRKIYINEDVPRETRALFNKAKKLKTETKQRSSKQRKTSNLYG
ncbi:hypothetical protein JTB14_037998 [Gonioctena quinquepunctata]|nr:hypothetical protein JTB14_037998 [Gonioctena quinquepunctata]